MRSWNVCGGAFDRSPEMPLEVPPPHDRRFGSPLVLSRVHWVRPELVAEGKYLTWTEDNLLRQVVYGRIAPLGDVIMSGQMSRPSGKFTIISYHKGLKKRAGSSGCSNRGGDQGHRPWTRRDET